MSVFIREGPLLIPFRKVPGPKDQLQNDFLQKRDERKGFQNVQFFLNNCLKMLRAKNLNCGSLQTILLCMVGELAGGGSMSVGVGVTPSNWHLTPDILHVTPNTWHLFSLFLYNFFKGFIVLVLLSSQVSCMQDW